MVKYYESPEELQRVKTAIGNTAYDAHYKHVPKEIRHLATRTSEDLSSNDENALVDIDVVLGKLEEEIRDLLSKLAPEAALTLVYGEQNTPWEAPPGCDKFGYARAAWVVGVYATGNDSSKLAAFRFYSKYIRWCATFLLREHISLICGNAVSLAEHVRAKRLLNPETRMRWISDTICLEIGRWVDRELQDQRNIWGSAVMRRINQNLMSAFKEGKTGEHLWQSRSEILLAGLPRELIECLTAKSSVGSSLQVKTMLAGETPSSAPIVSIGGCPYVLNQEAWVLDRDRAILNAVMGLLDQSCEGELLESITSSLLNEWGPSDVKWRARDTLAEVGKKSGFDIDVSGVSRTRTFLGECKANRSPENDGSLEPNFADRVMTRARKQIEKRVAAARHGYRLTSNTGHTLSSTTGFIVTLLDYGGSIWQKTQLNRYETGPEISIIPLHSFVFAVSIIQTGDELSDYLDMRSDLVLNSVDAYDELEFMLAWCNRDGVDMEKIRDAEQVQIRNYDLPPKARLSIEPDLASDRRSWKSCWQKRLMQAIQPTEIY